MRYVFLTVSFGVLLGRVASASDEATTNPVASHATRLARVRSEDSQIAAVIRRASERSTTFHRLITAIDRTDGLVYVENGKCGHGVRACLVLAVQMASGFRLLHIRVEPRQRNCVLMASIGHELQHAIELLRAPHVTSGAAAYLFYDRIAGQGRGADRGWFETEAADRTGLDIRYEACKAESR